MNVNISRELDLELKNASKTLGFGEDALVERAIAFYLDTIKKQVALKQEFASWDKLSDEALLSFEDKL